jgi:hypothetical protein
MGPVDRRESFERTNTRDGQLHGALFGGLLTFRKEEIL